MWERSHTLRKTIRLTDARHTWLDRLHDLHVIADHARIPMRIKSGAAEAAVRPRVALCP